MNVTTIVEPAAEPVTLAQVYLQLRLDYTVDSSPSETSHPMDPVLTGNIRTAREQVERISRRSLIEQTLRLSMPAFPAATACEWWPTASAVPRRIKLIRPPLIRVTSVRYFDAENVLRTIDPADYYVTDDLVPELRFVTGFARPVTYDRPDALRVEYVAGYLGTGSPPTTQAELAANVPQALKDAVLIGVELLQGDAGPDDRVALERLRDALLSPLVVLLEP